MVCRRAMSPAANRKPRVRGADRLALRTPAKVNLYLEIVRRRPDGYHEIRSVVTPVSLYDRVDLESTRGRVETRMTGPFAATCAGGACCGNITTRAAFLLKRATGYRGGAKIRVRKRIPVAAGLGGGSADAAAVLIGLNRLWNTGLSRGDLMELGARLGCDVPALIHGGPVRMEGLGEKVTPAAIAGGRGDARLWMALVYPGFGVLTADMYARCRDGLTSRTRPYTRFLSALAEGDFVSASGGLFNGLQETVFRKYPLIQIAAESLRRAGAMGVSLSGSGGCVFGLARDRRQGRHIARCVREAMGFPVWCRVVRTLPDGVTVAHGPLEA